MKLRFDTAVFAIILAVFGCRQEKNGIQPKRAEKMRFGDLEIAASLNRDGTAYSSQEDILLNFKIQNHGDSPSLAPMVGIHRATWKLKNIETGVEKVLPWKPTPQPGTPNFQDDPEVNLEPGQVWPPSLPLQDYLGFFPKGKYSARFELQSSKFPFATDWMPFEVNSLDVGASNSVPSTSGEARYLHHTWLDLGSNPPRIMFRNPFIGKQRPLAHRTWPIGEGDPNSVPRATTSPAGVEPANVFVGWLAGDSMHLARIKRDYSVTNLSLNLPFKATTVIGPLLSYYEKPGSTGSVLSGALLTKDSAGNSLHLFTMAAGGKPTWLPAIAISPGEIFDMRFIAVSPGSNAVLWVRQASHQAQVECLIWKDPPNAPVVAGSTPAAQTSIKALGATLVGDIIRWSLALVDSSSPDKGKQVVVHSHGFNVTDKRPSAGIPKSTAFNALSGPIRIAIEVDSEGTPWILQRDVHGAWVQNKDWPDPIAIETPRGSIQESLFFRRGNLPRVMVLDPDSGFQTKVVPFPTGSSDDDVIDDEQ